MGGKGKLEITTAKHTAEGVGKVTVSMESWYLPLHTNNPTKGSMFTISYICLSHSVHTKQDAPMNC